LIQGQGMAKEHITMSRKDVDRLSVIQSVISKQLTKRKRQQTMEVDND
jgi:hypothetical protein